MRKAVFENYSPVVKLFFLLILSIASLSVFLFFSSLIVRALWGFNIIDDPSSIENFSDPFVVDANRLILVFQQIGFFILPALIFLKLSTSDSKEFVSWNNNISLLSVGAAILLLVGFMPIINFFIWLNESMVFPDFLSGLEQAFRSMEDSAKVITEALIKIDSLPEFLYMSLLIALLPAIGEELIFRGIIQRLLSVQFKNYHLGIWGSAFLFSAIHFQFYGFLPRMLLGALFGYLLVYTGNIIYPMIAHFVNNFASLSLAYLMQNGTIPKGVDDIGSDLDWQFILPSFIISSALFYSFWKNRNKPLIKEYESLQNASSLIE